MRVIVGAPKPRDPTMMIDAQRWSTRPGSDEYAAYYGRYIERVRGNVLDALRTQLEATLALVEGLPEEKTTRGYAEGKWTIRELLVHVADAERIFGYRALRIARGDATPLPGFDENQYAPASSANARSMASVCDELRAVRRATVALVEGLPVGTEARRGVASGFPVTARAAIWTIAGHELHHRAILAERYL